MKDGLKGEDDLDGELAFFEDAQDLEMLRIEDLQLLKSPVGDIIAVIGCFVQLPMRAVPLMERAFRAQF